MDDDEFMNLMRELGIDTEDIINDLTEQENDEEPFEIHHDRIMEFDDDIVEDELHDYPTPGSHANILDEELPSMEETLEILNDMIVEVTDDVVEDELHDHPTPGSHAGVIADSHSGSNSCGCCGGH